MYDPSGHDGLAELLVTTGINVALNAITFGVLGFAWGKARGLRNQDAFLYGLKVGEAGALVSLPVVGPAFGLYYLYQAYESYRAGQWDNLTGWELASYIAAGVLMHRLSPAIADSIVKSGNTPAPVDGPPAPAIKFNIQDTVTGPRIEVNIDGQSLVIYADSVVAEGDTVTLRNVDIGSDLTNQMGISKLRAIAKGLSGQYGVSKVVVEGGVRTTGANPGKAPSVEFDFSGGTDSGGTVKQ